MFGLFGKRQRRHSSGVHELFDTFLKPMALAAALAKCTSKYFQEVEKGIIEAPAYKRKEASVIEVWRDTRFEVLRPLWGFGASSATFLADHKRQREILDCLLDEKPHLEFPHQPRGDEVRDTIQALFQVYVLMEEIGSEVACMETDHLNLKVQKKTIVDEFLNKGASLRKEWVNFERQLKEPKSDHGENFHLPKTVLEIFYEDITAKTKSIALTSQFGPHYRAGMEFLKRVVREKMEKQGAPEKEIQEALQKIADSSQRVLAATDPDHLT